MIHNFNLIWHPVGEEPDSPGDYILYNQCDGYHIVEGHFYADTGEFDEFRFFAGPSVTKDFYRAWAKLPEGHTTMYDLFAKK